MEFKIWPWELDMKPYWTNPENGVEWYIDESTTQYANKTNANGNPPLNAMCFLVVENIDGKRNPATRVLISKETNEVLLDDTSLEGMGVKIDLLRFSNSF